MLNEWKQAKGLAKLVVAFVFSSSPAFAEGDNPYLQYSEYSAVLDLFPQLKKPILPGGYTHDSLKFWAKGQMRIRWNHRYLEGDFDGNGIRDAALLVIDGGRWYLLVAEYADKSLKRKSIFSVYENSEIHKDGGIIRIRSSKVLWPRSFLKWDENGVHYLRGEIADRDLAQSWKSYKNSVLKLAFKHPGDLKVLTKKPGLCLTPRMWEKSHCEVEIYALLGKHIKIEKKLKSLGRPTKIHAASQRFFQVGGKNAVYWETDYGPLAVIETKKRTYFFLARKSLLLGRDGFEWMLSTVGFNE